MFDWIVSFALAAAMVTLVIYGVQFALRIWGI